MNHIHREPNRVGIPRRPFREPHFQSSLCLRNRRYSEILAAAHAVLRADRPDDSQKLSVQSASGDSTNKTQQSLELKAKLMTWWAGLPMGKGMGMDKAMFFRFHLLLWGAIIYCDTRYPFHLNAEEIALARDAAEFDWRMVRRGCTTLNQRAFIDFMEHVLEVHGTHRRIDRIPHAFYSHPQHRPRPSPGHSPEADHTAAVALATGCTPRRPTNL